MSTHLDYSFSDRFYSGRKFTTADEAAAANMSGVKLNRIRRLSATARYPHTFKARLANIDPELCGSLTAKQIAAIIDGPMQRSYAAGHQRILG